MNNKKKVEETFTRVYTDIMQIQKSIISGDEKLLLAKIVELDSLSSGCFATNAAFAQMLGTSNSFVSQKVTKLETMGFIQRTIFHNEHTKQVTKRILKPTFIWKNPEWLKQHKIVREIIPDNNELMSGVSVSSDGTIEVAITEELQAMENEQEASQEEYIVYPRTSMEVSFIADGGYIGFDGEVAPKEEVGCVENEREVSTKVDKVIDKLTDTEIDSKIDNVVYNELNNKIDNSKDNSENNLENTGPDTREKLESRIDELIAILKFELEEVKDKELVRDLLFDKDYKRAGYYIGSDMMNRLVPIVGEYLKLVDQYQNFQ